MEATLQALGALLLKAIPTIVLLLVVFLYLKWMFFRPLEKVLAERRQATQGTRQRAEALLAKASEKAATVEAELRAAREAVYQQQEEERRKWIAEQTAQVDQARQNAREVIQQARQQLEQDTAAAKRELAATAETLADQIAGRLLERKTA
jgi:F-type H+-transporting ATPase subunit b